MVDSGAVSHGPGDESLITFMKVRLKAMSNKFYRTVKELPDDCIYELKDRMFYGDDDHSPLFDCFACASEIPGAMVFRRYAGIEFVPDDFWSDGGSWNDFDVSFATFSDMVTPLDAINNWLSVFAN